MRSNTKSLARDMRHVADEVETLLADAGLSSGTVHQLKTRVTDAVDAARTRLGDLNTNVRSGASRAVTVTDDYVHESPWQAIGIGLVIGLAAGLLLMRRY